MKKIQLANNEQYALVDDEDYELVSQYLWHIGWSGRTNYACTEVNGSTVYMHTLILPPQLNMTTDHINHDGLDNRRCNLRYATVSQNRQNIPKYSGNKSSEYKGVWWSSERDIWRVEIKVNGKRINLGSFKNEKRAAREYDRAALKYFREFACLNFKE